MTEMKQIAKDIITNQHATKLLDKKINVIGALNTKTKDIIEETNSILSEQNKTIAGLTINDLTVLDDTAIKMEDIITIVHQKEDTFNELKSNIEKLDTALNQSILDSKSILQQDSDTNGKQLNDIATRVDEIKEQSNNHNQYYVDTLTHVKNKIEIIDEYQVDVESKNEKTIQQLETIITAFNSYVQTLSDKAIKYDELCKDIEQNVNKLDDFTKRIDQKVSDVSPHFQIPNASDVEDAFRELATKTTLDVTNVDIIDILPTEETTEYVDLETEQDNIIVQDEQNDIVNNQTQDEQIEIFENKKEKNIFKKLFGG